MKEVQEIIRKNRRVDAGAMVRELLLDAIIKARELFEKGQQKKHFVVYLLKDDESISTLIQSIDENRPRNAAVVYSTSDGVSMSVIELHLQTALDIRL